MRPFSATSDKQFRRGTSLANNQNQGDKKKSAAQHLKSVFPMIADLVRPRRGLLALSFLMLIVGRVAGLMLPYSPKILLDTVIAKHRHDLLLPLVGAVTLATLIQAVCSFSLTQLLSKEGQRLIAELRQKVQMHVGRLPLNYYDANKSGALVSRIMSDVEGVRNLIGTGLVEFIGGILTAVMALGILLKINAAMTMIAIGFLLLLTGALGRAFKTIRPIFRERAKINAEVTGRLTESLGGVRVVKGYHAEESEAKVFAGGVKRLLDNVISSLTAQSLMTLSSTLVLGVVGGLIMYLGAHETAAGRLNTGGYVEYTMLLAFMIAPIVQL